MKHFKPQQVLLLRGHYFGEEALLADDRCQHGQSTVATILEKLVSSELVFRMACKSLEGLVMSISIDEFVRMLGGKDDPTVKRLREQFALKTKIRSDKLSRLEEDEDYETTEESEEEQKPEIETSNPIRVFRQRQREYVKPQKKQDEIGAVNLE